MWRWTDLGRISRAVVIVPLVSHASVAPLAPLLQKRTLFFVGKGGVGKTTVATAFALAAAQQGKNTLLVEIGDNCRAARLFALPQPTPADRTPQEATPLLSVLSTSGAAALEEYLSLIIPVKRLVRLLVNSRPYQYFVAAAPGLKELLTIGKIWYEERKHDAETQRPRWDLIVVDLPATGHGLQYLNMPCAARDTFHEGIIHREAERITAWLHDADKVAINLVAAPEELPVCETVEAYQQLTETLQLPLGALFVNRVHEAPLSTTVLAQLHPASAQASLSDLGVVEQVVTCAAAEAAGTEAQDFYVQQLAQLPLPLVKLPLCFSRAFGAAQLETLALRLNLILRSEENNAFVRHSRQGRKRTRTSH